MTQPRATSVGPPQPSEFARSQVGQRIHWVQTEPKQREAEGVCIAVERLVGRTIRNERGEFPAVRYRIKTDDGRKVWTTSFADEGE